MNYNFTEIEKKWQQYWNENKTFKANNHSDKPKYYILDMFPYPSGSGLHVGHPLGYIASDIISRYKRLRGFNVLHPMGYDAFGLPAEQYAIQTGQHPAITTENNIKRYREQLDKIGFSFDWDREVRTCDPKYYKWTQWIFLKLFNSWYNKKADKAQPIETLIAEFEKNGNQQVEAFCIETSDFTSEEWNNKNEKERHTILLNYRLAYLSETIVNWCPALGTVLANEEVKDGLSERGGHPVEIKMMKQWALRITAYAERLKDGLEKINWSESIKEMQRNWIGKSEGAEIRFHLSPTLSKGEVMPIFTTRPDTIFGVTFMVVCPEYKLLKHITTSEQKKAVDEYVQTAKKRSERERLSDVKKVTGVFTGAYVIHPFTEEKIPIWVRDYVLSGYGTGAIMAVPSGDQRDWNFATHFNLPVIPLIKDADISKRALDDKEGIMINSDFMNGMKAKDAIPLIIDKIEEMGIGKRLTNYKLRDAIFSRQRYWGEPFPIYYKEEIPYAIDEEQLPLGLPEVDKYLPTETGEPPLARAKNWKTKDGFPLECSTMPGWAGSSWYYLRYMDADNNKKFVSKEAVNYWKNVDLYFGGAEHATGHLLYVRFWTKFLYDLAYLPFDEPAQKLINQGMILGENGEKMSKSKGNVVNPDDIIKKYGADTLRLHEMFLGPLEQHKPWNTKGIEGVHRFLKKLWRLYMSLSHPTTSQGEKGEEILNISDETPNREELKVLHKTIKKVQQDINNISFNTAVSTFMVCVNELTELKCNKRNILEPLTIIISPFAPHIAEELWQLLGHKDGITHVQFPNYKEEYIIENTYEYPISFNGKLRFKLELPIDLSKEEIEKEVLNCEKAQKWISNTPPKKVIVVPKRIVNVVV